MSKRVFRLKFVPNDEANGVRDALDDAGIEYFETPPGYLTFFGLNAAGIWVADSDEAGARVEIDAFQKQWLEELHTKLDGAPNAADTADRFMLKLFVAVSALALLALYFFELR